MHLCRGQGKLWTRSKSQRVEHPGLKLSVAGRIGDGMELRLLDGAYGADCCVAQFVLVGGKIQALATARFFICGFKNSAGNC